MIRRVDNNNNNTFIIITRSELEIQAEQYFHYSNDYHMTTRRIASKVYFAKGNKCEVFRDQLSSV